MTCMSFGMTLWLEVIFHRGGGGIPPLWPLNVFLKCWPSRFKTVGVHIMSNYENILPLSCSLAQSRSCTPLATSKPGRSPGILNKKVDFRLMLSGMSFIAKFYRLALGLSWFNILRYSDILWINKENSKAFSSSVYTRCETNAAILTLEG